MRNGPNDTSQSPESHVPKNPLTCIRTGINFQKASCTLDGCVKVWTSRVDSVATETGKLLSGLADDLGVIEEEDENAHEEGEGDEDAEDGTKKAKKRVCAHRNEGCSRADYPWSVDSRHSGYSGKILRRTQSEEV